MKTVRAKLFSLLFLTCFLTLAAISGAAQTVPAKNENSPSVVKPDEAAIDFEFNDLNGKARKFNEFRGKIVLLDFWATWCAPCLADIPKLKAIYQKHKANGLEIVGMNVETLSDDAEDIDAETARENAARVKQIIASRKVEWAIATTETAVPVATKMFGIESLPAKILIDQDGKVIAELGEKDDLEAIVAKLLAAK